MLRAGLSNLTKECFAHSFLRLLDLGGATILDTKKYGSYG